MNINKFESKYEIPPGEITKTISEIYPRFTKVEMSMVRHPEHGVVLAPKACKYLKSKYEPPKEKQPSYRITCQFTEDEYNKIMSIASSKNIKPSEVIRELMI